MIACLDVFEKAVFARIRIQGLVFSHGMTWDDDGYKDHSIMKAEAHISLTTQRTLQLRVISGKQS